MTLLNMPEVPEASFRHPVRCRVDFGFDGVRSEMYSPVEQRNGQLCLLDFQILLSSSEPHEQAPKLS